MQKYNLKLLIVLMMILYFAICQFNTYIIGRRIGGPFEINTGQPREDYVALCKSWQNCRGPYTGNFPKAFRPKNQYDQIKLQYKRILGSFMFPGFLYLLGLLIFIFLKNIRILYFIFPIHLAYGVLLLLKGFLSYEDFLAPIIFLILLTQAK